MFFELLWVAFLIEWLVGISVGWLLANFYWRRRTLRATDSPEQIDQGFLSSRATGTGSDGKAAVIQALAQDRSTIQRHLLKMEQTLADTEALLNKANNDLAVARTAQAQSDAILNQRDEEIKNLKARLAEEQAGNAAMAASLTQYKQAALEAEALAMGLDQSKADLTKTAMKLEADLEAAIQSRERVLQQLAVHKERLRIVTADLARANQTKSNLENEIQAREQQINDLTTTMAQLRSALTSNVQA